MELSRNVDHKFDLTCLRSGDQFLGCSQCWFRLDPGVAAKPICPNCGSVMDVFYVTKRDLS